MQVIEIGAPTRIGPMSNDNINEELAEAAKRIYEEYGGNLQCFFNVILAEDESRKLTEPSDHDSVRRMMSSEQNASEAGTARKS
jgi:hypothetical protein